MAFDIDFKERGFLKEHIWDFLLFPDHWNDPLNQIKTPLVWNEIPFDSVNQNLVPNNQKGVYCFVLKPVVSNLFDTRYLMYVGKTTRDFRARFKEYINEAAGKGKPRPKVFSMLKLWKNYLHFYYASIPNDSDIDECETKYLNTLVPKVNTDIPKAKIKPELKNIYE